MDKKTNSSAQTRQSAFAYVLKKAERISAVNTILAQTLPATVFIKDSLSQKTIPLLETALALKSGRFGVLEDTVARLRDELQALESVYEVARHGRVIANSNALIMIDECRALRRYLYTEVIRDYAQDSTADVGISSEMFTTGVYPSIPDQESTEVSQVKPQHTPFEQNPQFKRTDHKRHTYSDLYNLSDKHSSHRNLSKTVATSSKSNATPSKQKDRRAQILALLQRKDKISVKDVAKEITDCSEKTLQRELLALVAQGVLKKEGERRWSTYALA